MQWRILIPRRARPYWMSGWSCAERTAGDGDFLSLVANNLDIGKGNVEISERYFAFPFFDFTVQ